MSGAFGTCEYCGIIHMTPCPKRAAMEANQKNDPTCQFCHRSLLRACVGSRMCEAQSQKIATQ